MSHDSALYAAIAILILAGLLSFSRSTTGNDQSRLARLEAKVNLMLDKLGIAHDSPGDEVRDYLRQGMKINAIKAYRQQYPGVGLKDAKDSVEAMEQQMKAGSAR